MDLKIKERIDNMSQKEMAIMWRFAPVGETLLQGEVGDYFSARFKALGGFNPQLSKEIGW